LYNRRTRLTNIPVTFAAGSDFVFDIADSVRGSSISYNTTNGELTLAAGRTYELIGAVGATDPSIAGEMSYQWRTSTGTFVGNIGTCVGIVDGLNSLTPQPQARAIVEITGSTDTVLTLRVLANNLSAILGPFTESSCFLMVREL
jgi:hypothetical protein